MKNLLKNSKGQVSSTLTWFFATVIIFFIMVLFLTASITYSKIKKVSNGYDEISLQKYSLNLRSERVLFSLLNSNINLSHENKKLKDWLISDIYNMEGEKKSELKNKINELILSNTQLNDKNECYSFLAVSGVNPDKIGNVDPRGQAYVSDFIEKSSIHLGNYDTSTIDSRGQAYANIANTRLLNKAVNLVLVRDTTKNIFGVDTGNYEQVIIKFYIGAC